MLFKFIDIRYFIVSLCVGLLYIYLSNEYQKVIVLYPNPTNLNKYTYVDKANNCFNYALEQQSECPSSQDKYINVGVSY